MGTKGLHPGYRTVAYPDFQRQMIDWMDLMHRQHTVHALVEVDVSEARRAIREHRASTGEGLSFTAFIVSCFARAIHEDKRMHAYRKGRNHLVLFDDVDVTVLVESELEGAKIPIPHIIRGAQRKSPSEITAGIRSSQVGDAPYAAGRRWLPLWLRLPGFLRRFVWTRLLADPGRRKRLTGTAVVTAVGMFGHGIGWAIPLTNYTICLTIGSIARKPVVVADDRAGHQERIEVRDCLALTISIDHDVVDGAPAARFAVRLKELIEGAAGLADAPKPLPVLASSS